MMMFVVTSVAIMEDLSITEGQSAYFFRVEARYKCGQVRYIGLKEDP
jgi:hypothetical protein